MSCIIHIEPLEFKWAEWRTKARELTPRCRAAEKVCHECQHPLHMHHRAANGTFRCTSFGCGCEQANVHPAVSIAAEVGRWQNEVDAWLRALNAKKQRDLIELLKAECDMLWETIDPSHPSAPKPQHGSEEFTDFRERFHQAQPLALAAVRVGLEKADGALRWLEQLQDFAEQKHWLP